ncbi:hypothetical protein L0664_01860 [Octadecabacter sp. G9-8]|uniref:Uncharacterized protein n=1 Tax=Octadecabacter dasysiphoniae TaxID=2909341 RepID=A0ABS9CS88_9RHOB|nr:hypothetical protein [Octadecabacter dasysiphoniae]MCF2869801.1 hypothetical protein [Octadecabacter dasysiphoniae]
MTSLHPFRTPRLSGAEVGWARPLLAVVFGLAVPSLMGWVMIYIHGATLSGPPKDGSGYTLNDHLAFVSAFVAASIIVTWMMIPIAVMAMRAAAMLGWAGWGTALLGSWAVGLPVVHVMLNGDLTTDGNGLLPHITLAIAILALSIWASFWALLAVWETRPVKKPEF